MPTPFGLLKEQSIAQLTALVPFVEGLSAEDWRTPSACGGWEVGEVVAHLASGTGMWAALIPAMVRGEGDGGADWSLPNPSRHDQVRADSVERRKEVGDAALGRELAENAAKLIDVLTPLTDDDADKSSPGAWGGQGNVKTTVGTIVGETIFHRWDMESRVRPDAHLPSEAFPAIMGYVAGWRGFGFQKRSLPAPIHYRWSLSDPPSTWDVLVKGDSFQHLRNPDREPDVVFETDTEAYILAGVGRMDLVEAVKSGRVKASGPAEAVAAYQGFFASM